MIIIIYNAEEKKYLKDDASLETLLDLNGEIFPMDNGSSTKFEAPQSSSDRIYTTWNQVFNEFARSK